MPTRIARNMALFILQCLLELCLFLCGHCVFRATYLKQTVGTRDLGDYMGGYGIFPGYFMFFLVVPVRLLLWLLICVLKAGLELTGVALEDVHRALGPLPTPPDEEDTTASNESAGFTGVPEDTWDDSDDEPEDSDSTGQSDGSPEQTDDSTEASEVDDLEDIGMFIEQYLPAEEMVRQTCPASVVTRKY
jgi:hypothetical protein